MKPFYYVLDAVNGEQIPANIRAATKGDFQRTEDEHWQTSWLSAFIQDEALELADTHELVGLGAYRDVPEGRWSPVETVQR